MFFKSQKTALAQTKPSFISYLCFTYIEFKENYPADFTPDSLLEFFSITEKTRARYEEVKCKQCPCSHMMFGSTICSDENFEQCNQERTDSIFHHWQEKSGIPDEISRFVFKLALPEREAKALYQTMQFSTLGRAVIERREDTISKQASIWTIGEWEQIQISTVLEEENTVEAKSLFCSLM